MSVFTKVYKLWGRGVYEKNNNGEYVIKQHRIKSSFNNSVTYDFSQSGDNRIITIYNFDKTGSHDYSQVEITRNNEIECDSELLGQVSDGYFKNYYVGHIEGL